MATAPKKASAVIVIRDRNTIKLPPCQLGSFHKLFEPDEYEGKKKFKSRFHYNVAGLEALEETILAKCIQAHYETMKSQVDDLAAAAKADGKTPTLKIVPDIGGCQSAKEWIEDKLKDPHPKDKVQLPTVQLHVDYLRPTKRNGESVLEPREIQFWDAKGKLIADAPKALAKMTAGTWGQPVVHANLFLSKQLGPAPRAQLQLVGFQIIKLEEFGRGGAEQTSEADDDEMRRIMGADYSAADDLSNLLGSGSMRDAESGLEMASDDDSPF